MQDGMIMIKTFMIHLISTIPKRFNIFQFPVNNNSSHQCWHWPQLRANLPVLVSWSGMGK